MTDNELAECYRAGLTLQEIADGSGLHRDTVRRRLRTMGVRIRRRGPRPAKRERAVVASLLADGLTSGEIAGRAGCSVGLVSKVARLKGW